MELEFAAVVWEWRGPAPYHFVSVPEDACAQLQEVAVGVSYGWGMVPVTARLGATTWTTSLFPKDGGYALPLKSRVRTAEQVELGQTVTVRLAVSL